MHGSESDRQSYHWTRRVAKNNNLLWTSRKSDATYFTESQLENMRVGVSLQMSGFDSLQIINTDETPLYNLQLSF